jgi:hypothetical protein
MSLRDVSEFIKLIPDTCSVMQIACTDRNTFVLSTSGKIYSWGELTFALGRKPKEEKDLVRPMLLYSIEKENIANIACGTNHVLALSSDRKVFSWGDNTFGQLGHGDTLNRIEPAQVLDVSDVVRISAGPEFSVAITEKQDKSVLTFMWGNNNQIKLRKVNDDEQARSVAPVKVLQPAWGSQNPQITIKSNKRGKNYAFKSIVGNDVEMGNLTKGDVEIIQTENSHLLRKFEILTQRSKELEKSVYNCDLSADAGGITEDPVLQNIIQILNKTNLDREKKEKIIKEKEQYLQVIEKNISKIEVDLKSLQVREEASRELIDKLEDDIKYFEYEHDKQSLDDRKLLTIQKANVTEATEEFSKICDEKTRKQKKILVENDKASFIKEEIQKLKENNQESERRAKIFTQIKGIRKEQLIYNFFEHSQKAVNKEIDNMESIYDIVKDSEIEAISKNLQKNNLNEYIEHSLMGLEHLLSEIEMMKKPEKPKKIKGKVLQDLSLEDEKEEKAPVNQTTQEDVSNYSSEEEKEYIPIEQESSESLEDKLVTEEDKPKEVRINFVYKKLNIIWTALEKFIFLTQEKDTLIYGLLQETVNSVCRSELLEDEDETEEIGDKRELMKKILSKSKLTKTMQVIENKRK